MESEGRSSDQVSDIMDMHGVQDHLTRVEIYQNDSHNCLGPLYTPNDPQHETPKIENKKMNEET